MTTEKLLTECLEVYQKEHIKARTYSRYQGLISMHIVPTLGEQNISDVGRREIQEFLTQQKKDGNMRNGEKLSATSTNMMLSILNLAFEYACDMEYIEENPCVRVRRTKAETKKLEAFTVDEQRAIEREIARSDDRRLHGILLCLYTGLRIGGLFCSLRSNPYLYSQQSKNGTPFGVPSCFGGERGIRTLVCLRTN